MDIIPKFSMETEKEALSGAISDRILFLGIMVSTCPEEDTLFINKCLSEICCLYDYANRHNINITQ